ncbi:copine-8 [Hyaloraphidium curvatum]|nr:copine-8 [Hyaloraphidium curvatum]
MSANLPPYTPYPAAPPPTAGLPSYNASAPGPGPAAPAAKVELRFSCSQLPNLDITSKSDPQLFVFLRQLRPGPPGQTAREVLLEIGRTEVIRDSLNPRFAKAIVMDYIFESVQNLRIVCLDVDNPSPTAPLRDHDYLGHVDVQLGNLVASGKVNAFERKFSMQVPPGMQVEELDAGGAKQSVTLRLRGSKLDKKDFFGKSDPFIVISKARNDGAFAVVHKTEVIKNTLDPVWQPFKLKLDVLCGGDVNRMLRFECFDWDRDGTHDLIGIFQAPLSAFTRGATFALIEPKKQAKKGKSYTNSGTIIVDDVSFQREYSFLDYITAGTEIELAVSIDFTQSNGDPNHPASLHYRNPNPRILNEYQRALSSVGQVLEPYDADGRFLAYGFGAKLPDGTVSHFFPLNGAVGPEVIGVAGLMEAYNKSLYGNQLWGPTIFATTINSIGQWVRSSMPPGDRHLRKYCILLIITDGAITDLDQTIKAVVDASALPMSIIIVGVGGADFSSMDLLDSDDAVLQAGGKRAERDCVQFVPFRAFNPNDFGALSAATLAEVPEQLVQYATRRGLKPIGEP